MQRNYTVHRVLNLRGEFQVLRRLKEDSDSEIDEEKDNWGRIGI